MKKLLYTFFGSGIFFLLPSTVSAVEEIVVPRPVNVPAVEIGNVISAVVGILLIIAAILAFLYLILGGIQWITSGGDKTAMETARGKITNAIVGLIIVAAAWAVMLLIGKFVGVDLLGSTGLKIPTIEVPNP